ncbi:MAG: GFA family protein [Rhodanobacteraceae bacterium]
MKSAETKLIGGCLCGSVRYAATGEPKSVGLCHCESCRRASGAPVVSWFVIALDQFAITGELTRYASSADVVRAFCAKCGTPISYVHRDAPSLIELTSATLDEPDRLVPTRESWLSEKIAWMCVDPARQHFPASSGE